MFPTHGPLFQPTPVTILILSLFDNLARAALALVYADAQAPVPVPGVPELEGLETEVVEVVVVLEEVVVDGGEFVVTGVVVGLVLEVVVVVDARAVVLVVTVEAEPGTHW